MKPRLPVRRPSIRRRDSPTPSPSRAGSRPGVRRATRSLQRRNDCRPQLGEPSPPPRPYRTSRSCPIAARPGSKYHCVDHQVRAINSTCIGVLIHSGVAGLPRNVTPARAARTLAGKTATRKRINAMPLIRCTTGTRRPIAPSISQMPVMKTTARGRGTHLRTVRIISSFMEVKWALAVKTSMTARA